MKPLKVKSTTLIAVLNQLAGLIPLAAIVVSLVGTLPARGAEIPFTERVITEDPDGPGGVQGFTNLAYSVFAADVDGDGDIDVLSASLFNHKITWYENNPGAPGLPPTFTARVISTTALCANSVFAADVDGDGDTDVLSTSQCDDKIAWYENVPGAPGFPPIFTEHVISTTAVFARSVFATDVDGDGDVDVLSASQEDDKIAWYENNPGAPGLPPTFTEHVISTTANSAQSVFATDLDGDGDTDVLSASALDGKIAWYENNPGAQGLPPTFTERVIAIVGGASSVYAIDVDGDGDTDVLAALQGDDKIAWYENDGGSPPSFTERVIPTVADGASSVFATDMDGDGDIDILSASQLDSKIAWYENVPGAPGLPPTFTEHVISTVADRAIFVFAMDLDSDGDTDVLSASWNDDKIAWYENHSPCGFDSDCDGDVDMSDFAAFQAQIKGPQ